MKLSEVKIKVQIENATLKQRFGLWIINKKIRLIQWLFEDDEQTAWRHLKEIFTEFIKKNNSDEKCK